MAWNRVLAVDGEELDGFQKLRRQTGWTRGMGRFGQQMGGIAICGKDEPWKWSRLRYGLRGVLGGSRVKCLEGIRWRYPQERGDYHPPLPSAVSCPGEKQNVSNKNLTLRVTLWNRGLKAGLGTERSSEMLFSSAVSEICVKNEWNRLTFYAVLTEVDECIFKSVPEILDVGST